MARPKAIAMGRVTTASSTVSCRPCHSSGQMRTNESQSAKLSRKSFRASTSVSPRSQAFQPAAGDDQRYEEHEVERGRQGERRGVGGDRHGALRAAEQLGEGDGGAERGALGDGDGAVGEHRHGDADRLRQDHQEHGCEEPQTPPRMDGPYVARILVLKKYSRSGFIAGTFLPFADTAKGRGRRHTPTEGS